MLKEEKAPSPCRSRAAGPLGRITVVSGQLRATPRGYVQNPQVDLPCKGQAKLDVGTAVGLHGSLTVIKDLRMKEPYVGTCPVWSPGRSPRI
ncbi:MAG: Hsp33 family molecular chaperone HslO [Oscillospiraceae bacterium]